MWTLTIVTRGLATKLVPSRTAGASQFRLGKRGRSGKRLKMHVGGEGDITNNNLVAEIIIS